MYHGPGTGRLAVQTARRTSTGAVLASSGTVPIWAHYGWVIVAVGTIAAAAAALLRLLPTRRRRQGDEARAARA
jgi:hypothetical protein